MSGSRPTTRTSRVRSASRAAFNPLYATKSTILVTGTLAGGSGIRGIERNRRVDDAAQRWVRARVDILVERGGRDESAPDEALPRRTWYGARQDQAAQPSPKSGEADRVDPRRIHDRTR